MGVNDAEEMRDALAQGWHATLPDAIDPPAGPIPDTPEDDAPPTRAELEAKAQELGLKFNGRNSDATLGKMISGALNGLD